MKKTYYPELDETLCTCVLENGLTVADEVYGFWVFTDYSQPSPEDYIMLWVPVK